MVSKKLPLTSLICNYYLPCLTHLNKIPHILALPLIIMFLSIKQITSAKIEDWQAVLILDAAGSFKRFIEQVNPAKHLGNDIKIMYIQAI